jgi:hypothetical protein
VKVDCRPEFRRQGCERTEFGRVGGENREEVCFVGYGLAVLWSEGGGAFELLFGC